MDNAHYAELFLTESREHVSAVNQWLLQLEQAAATSGGEPRAAEAVSAIFRSVHTIKGMSATMGYTAVAELSHELESVLDRIRRLALPVTPGVTDLLFRSADVLEIAIEASVTGAEAPSVAEVLRRLRALGATPAIGSAAVPALAGDAWEAAAPEGSGILVRVRLAPDTPLKGVRALLVLQALARLGEVTVASPGREALQDGEFGGDFALRLVTSAPGDEIERVVRGAGDVADAKVGEDDVEHVAAALDALPVQPEPAPAPAATNGAATVTANTPGTGRGQRPQQHVRIELRRLDSLMNLIGELVITRGRLHQISTVLDDPALTESVGQASRLIADLRDEIMTSRMVPVWQVFDRFPRMVRDTARALNKEIMFSIEGKEIELDRSMLDEIGDPIVHLLRNAADHGVESPDERVAAGKPRTGRLTLSAARDRSAVVIRVTDDGRGIDRERVLTRARKAGLVEETRTEISDDELFRLVARPGFSTAERVTDLSGRGVGIDAVFTRVRSLGGSVDMRSVPGQGTTVTLRLPLTLAIVRALLARVNDEVYAVPLTHVSETVELLPDIHRTVRGREVLVLRESVVPLLRLRALVGLPASDGAMDHLEQAVVIDLPDRRAALVVDELAGQQEIVVKQFDAVRDGLTMFGGATILGDGSPALIVDVGSLLQER